MTRIGQFGRIAAVVGLLLSILVFCTAAFSQDTALPPLIEVYWKSTAHLGITGVSNVVVLDPDIADVNVSASGMEFVGVTRGETVVLLTLNGKQMSTRVRVVSPPPLSTPPSQLLRQEELAHGAFSSNVQVANTRGAGSTVSIVNGVTWSQMLDDKRRFDFQSSFESDGIQQTHGFNIRRASALYSSPRFDVQVLDFNINVTGGPANYLSQYSFNDNGDLRGARVTYRGDRNRYTLFGGTTIPYYYLVLGATRDVAGFQFQRQQTDNLLLFTGSTFINAPKDQTGIQTGRLSSFMQTAGLAYRLRNRWFMRGTGGVSNYGRLAEGELDYSGHRMSAFVAAYTSSPLFPLNQLQSIFTGTTYIKSGMQFRNTEWLGESFSYEHSITQAAGTLVHPGTSDYMSSGLWLRFKKGQDINLNYTYSRQQGGFVSGESTGNRVDVNLHSQFGRISNAAQFSMGSLQDALGLNSEDRFSINDSIVVPIKRGSLLFGFQHSRTNPSLISRINSELGLLSPALQQLFLQDPVSFVNSGNLPPEVRALVESSQPVGTGITAASELRLTDKLMLSPSFSFNRSSYGTNHSWTPFLGYSLAYRLRPTIQLNSSMTNVWVLAGGQAQRTTVFSFGITKTFAVTPLSFNPLKHGRSIEGRVFRDNNISGSATSGEPGLSGVKVALDDGQTATTDKEGRFRFRSVSAGLHQVSIDVDQFGGPVRMTTSSLFQVDLIREKQATVNFGIINFARVMGNVYNDLRFHNTREPDAKGMSEIKMTLEGNGWKRDFATEGTGDYEIDDVPPGQYTLNVDASSLPANYSLMQRKFSVIVTPVSTVIQDVPVRALRSISGTVYLQVASDDAPGSKPTLVPMPDLQITAGYGIAVTDKNGEFLLRDLPAGDLTITLVPMQQLPKEIKVPSGVVHMPADPVQIHGAHIVITNPDLVQFLIGKTAKQVRDEGFAAAAARRQMNQ